MSVSAAVIALVAEGRTVPVRIVQVQTDTGFDWGDAGIGAAVVIALAAIAYGGAIARASGARRAR